MFKLFMIYNIHIGGLGYDWICCGLFNVNKPGIYLSIYLVRQSIQGGSLEKYRM